MTPPTENTTTTDELAVLRTKVPEPVKARLEHILSQQGMTTYEYLQLCVFLLFTFSQADEQWIRTADTFKRPFMQMLYSLLTETQDNKEFLRTIRQLEGMQDIRNYDLTQRIESIVVAFKGGSTATMQSPGIFAEMSYNASDALDSIINHIEPLRRVITQIKGIVGESTPTADILHLSLSDHLEDVRHGGSSGYAMNEYGNVPVRHNNKSFNS